MHADVVGDDLRPVALVASHQVAEHEAAGRVEVAFDADTEQVVDSSSSRMARSRHSMGMRRKGSRAWGSPWVFLGGTGDLAQVDPAEGVQRALGATAVASSRLLDETHDGDLEEPPRPAAG